MTVPLPPKDPTEIKDYSIDWSDDLPAGETISTSVWATSDPTGLTVSASSNTTTVATVVVSGGTSGVEYRMKNTVTTSGGKILARTLCIPATPR